MARTCMDAINVEMEHDTLDFMPCGSSCADWWMAVPPAAAIARRRCSWRPASSALDEAYMRANSWVIQQLLDCGIHGIHMCHARDTKAVQVATQMACRYPFDRPGIAKLPMQGLRGSCAGLCRADLGRGR